MAYLGNDVVTKLMKRSRLLLTTLALSILLIAGALAIYESHNRPVTAVRVGGDIRFTDRDELQVRIESKIKGSLYQIDVADVRNGALSLAWVKDASVRRVWPDALHVSVVERVPVARWGEGLIEMDATVFFPESTQAFQDLPLLEGPPGTEKRVLDRYWSLQQSLKPLNWKVRELTLSARRAWVLNVDNGIRLNLGQIVNDVNIVSLVRALQGQLGDHTNQIDQVDLRYTNGFTILWMRNLQAQSGGAQG